MGIRGHGAEIAVGVSSLLFAAGVTADAAAEHVGVNEAVVHQLDGRSDAIHTHLDQINPKLEALYEDGAIKIRDAAGLGASTEWFSLHRELDHVDSELHEAKQPNGVLNLSGKLGWFLGLVATFGSLNVLVQTTDDRRLKNLQKRKQIRESLDEGSNIERLVYGLQRDDIPKIDIRTSALALAAFHTEDPIKALKLFAKRTDNETAAIGALEVVKGYSAADKYVTQTIDFMKPLFGAKMDIIDGAYVVRDFGNRIATFVSRCTELWALEMRAHYRGNEELYAEIDPNEERHSVTHALWLLDKILPLDQNASENPRCEFPPDSPKYGIHWIDYISVQARKLNAHREPVEV